MVNHYIPPIFNFGAYKVVTLNETTDVKYMLRTLKLLSTPLKKSLLVAGFEKSYHLRWSGFDLLSSVANPGIIKRFHPVLGLFC